MPGSRVRDACGVVHHMWMEPAMFVTTSGGIPGKTACGRLFYDNSERDDTCSVGPPKAWPMQETTDVVDCMTCLVREGE